MVFGNSALQIDHSAGFGIHFNALDALKLVDNKHDLMKVAVAEEWQNSRWEEITRFYDTSVILILFTLPINSCSIEPKTDIHTVTEAKSKTFFIAW